MGKTTEIAWCDSTFNPWWGCTKVSPGCDNCYAERDSNRWSPGLWGVTAARRKMSDQYWRQPYQWNLKAIKEGTRPRVFCASMGDVFDNHPDVLFSRNHLWAVIRETQHLDWLILTKRIGNAVHMLPEDWEDGYANVWLGISVVNQAEADRDIPKLLKTPAALRFLSVEPMLGRIDLLSFTAGNCLYCGGAGEFAAAGATTNFPEDDDGMQRCYECMGSGTDEDNAGLDWVICGGESGPRARPMDPDWALRLRFDCADTEIPFFMKQGSADWKDFRNLDAFPATLQVREWPPARVPAPKL